MGPLVNMQQFKDLNVGFALDEGQSGVGQRVLSGVACIEQPHSLQIGWGLRCSGQCACGFHRWNSDWLLYFSNKREVGRFVRGRHCQLGQSETWRSVQSTGWSHVTVSVFWVPVLQC